MKSKPKQQSIPSSDHKPIFTPKIACILLFIISFIQYYPSINAGYTELDDSIFIKENKSFNQDIGNIFTSFTRGVFKENKDSYYRPVLLQSFILNYQLSQDNITSYHIVNILLHSFAVILLCIFLYRVLGNISIAFLLSLLFAVHPAISQAVAWIPGRNDSLLAIGILGFFIYFLSYLDSGKRAHLLIQFLFLLFALFTKETALFVVPIAIFYLLWNHQLSIKNHKSKWLFFSWFITLSIWAVFRSMASIQQEVLDNQDIVLGFFPRSLVAIHYLGKIFFPIQLSVFPTIQDTGNLLGFLALTLLSFLLFFSPAKNNKLVVFGAVWYLAFLIPTFLLPGSINIQSFEHRMYVPLIGILILISQSFVFTKWNIKFSALLILSVCIIFSVINFNHQKNFKSPLHFWASAVETSPHSSYANMMYATRISKKDSEKAVQFMQKAHQLNPTERYVNYHLGKMYLERGNQELAEKFLTAELNNLPYFDTYFQLSKLKFAQKDLTKSIFYIEKYLEKNPIDFNAIQNYLLMLIDNQQVEKARAFILQCDQQNISISQELRNKVFQTQ